MRAWSVVYGVFTQTQRSEADPLGASKTSPGGKKLPRTNLHLNRLAQDCVACSLQGGDLYFHTLLEGLAQLRRELPMSDLPPHKGQ